MKPAKKAAHAHKPHAKHPGHAKKAAHTAKKAHAAKKHPGHKKHPGAAGGHQKAGRAKAAPGVVSAEVYLPDDVDARDHIYPATTSAPAFVDLAPRMMPVVWYQGADAESCVLYASLAVANPAARGLAIWPVVADEPSIRDAVKACAEAAGAEYLAVPDLQACLSDGLPVVFGITLHESFADEPAVYDPAPDEPVLGPHCMVAVGIGYGHEWAEFPDADPDIHYVKVRNSWGTDAHHNGHLLIPTDHLTRHAADFWTIRSAR